MPQISVIVPVYRTEPYLRRCVDSLRGQSFQDLEILLVDDGSPDGCPALCDAFAAEDGRIRVIHQPNRGVAAARNAGLDAARGDYLAFADSDDYLEAEMLEKMLRTAEDYACDVVLCDCRKEYGDRTELYTHEIRDGYYDREQLQNEYDPHLLMRENVEYPATISNWLLLFRRELLEPGERNRAEQGEELRYPEGIRFSEDLLFGARLLHRANSFYYLKGQALYHYCMNPGSATHVFCPDKWRDYRSLYSEAERIFLADTQRDYRPQLDRMLLFFVYNAVGDLRAAEGLSRREKKREILRILDSPEVQEMFSRLSVRRLPISWKQKGYTLLYRHKVGLGVLLALKK